MKDMRYRISFYRTVLNEAGRQCHHNLETVEIRSARSMERAIEAGKRRFARSWHVPGWDHVAHGFDVAASGPGAGRGTETHSSDDDAPPPPAGGKH